MLLCRGATVVAFCYFILTSLKKCEREQQQHNKKVLLTVRKHSAVILFTM